MGFSRLVLVAIAAACALATPAAAQRVELAGRVTASETVLAQRRVGEARYMAVSDLFYRDTDAYLEVLDLDTQHVIQVKAPRALFEASFGTRGEYGIAVPRGDIVLFRSDVVGLALEETCGGPEAPRRVWYAELSVPDGKLVRSVDLGTLGPGEYLQIVGVDVALDQAWFSVLRPDPDTPDGHEVVLRRLDLDSLAVSDEQRLPLAPRGSKTGYERDLRVHAAPDFARFAVVEYYEHGMKMAPGKVYVVDPSQGTTFSVPAPATTYGVAFSRDGSHLYLGSAQRGTISRVDLAAQKIDKVVSGPRYMHHLVVSPKGTELFALSSSKKYVVYDLPGLTRRTEARHVPGVAAAMSQLFGNGMPSLDGAYFVVPDATPRVARRRERGYVIARFVD